jgi:hypothetical protein
MRRCPSCGGLVGADAQWCGQCLTPLDREGQRATTPAPRDRPPDPAPALSPVGTPDGRPIRTGSHPSIRPGEGGILWECPTCQTENPIEATTCRGCGTPFSRLLEDEPQGPTIEPRRAVGLSLVFPGLGHMAGGRGAEGAARAVVFAYALVTVVAILAARWGEGMGPLLPLLLTSGAAGAALYVLTAVDAGRLARGEQPILSTRALLYGSVGLILLTIVVLVVLGSRIGGRG